MNRQHMPHSIDGEFQASPNFEVSPQIIVLVASEDMAEARKLSLPIMLVEVSGSLDHTIFRNEAGSELLLDQIMLELVGCLVLSAQGHQSLIGVASFWSQTVGVALPGTLFLETENCTARRSKVLEWLIIQMAAARQTAAVRSARLMRELGILRRQHEETQTGFRDLETFLYRTGSQARMLDITLSPVSGQMPLVLRHGSQLIQRLPGSSVGLSDVSLHISKENVPTNGVLNVSLHSPDTGDTLANWEHPTSTLDHGWLRFTIERALGSDAVTLLLSISYHGNGMIKLTSSVQHPEARFQAQIDNQSASNIPALQIWRWIAGAIAPIAARSVLPVNGTNRMRRIAGEALTAARDLNDPKHTLPLQPDSSALLVHVLQDRIAGGVLSGIDLIGVRHVYADVRTFHPEAPNVEYRIALLPRSTHFPRAGTVPSIVSELASGWVRLAAMEDGQVHLILPQPLEQPCDVYLLTRLPEGVSSTAYGWSTFANLILQY